ncbi:hypothetical protein [Enterococcus sp. AZ080]|uniref:hypothetical protein n=1 Tax=Enterococcus sp. AZ080 TaxID=2774793 RepID=UPI003F2918AF
MKKMLFFMAVIGIVTFCDAVSAQEVNQLSEQESEIANKVVNSADFYDRVSISFREKYGNLSDREYQVQAKLDFSKGILDEEFVEVFEDETTGEQKAIIYDKSQNNNLVDIDFKQKDYFISQYNVDVNQANKMKSIENRLTKNASGETVLNQRDSVLPLSMSADAVFSQLYGAQLFSLYNHWEIIQTEKLLGRDVVMIEGEYPDELGIKLNAQNFKAWIDEETGVILKLEGFVDSVITNYLIVDTIDFDSEVSIRDIDEIKNDNLEKYRFPKEKQYSGDETSTSVKKSNLAKQPRIDSYVIDNDPLAGQGTAANYNFNWIANASAFNGEERYVSSDSNAWYFYSLNGGYTNYQVQAYVCSPRAYSTATGYWSEYLTTRIGTLNQNLAACGWNTFSDSYTFFSHLRINVARSTNSVADGINFRILN